MADNLTPEQRSYSMSRIRSERNQTTELRLIEIMRKVGIKGWRRGIQLLGKPDFVFRKERVAIFVDGCYWHGCAKCQLRPKSNSDYWTVKMERNRGRDRTVSRVLRKSGWRVLRLWEHSLKRTPGRCAGRIRAALAPQATRLSTFPAQRRSA